MIPRTPKGCTSLTPTPTRAPIHIDRVSILRTAEGEPPEEWSRALADPSWLASSQILKQEGAAWVRRATLRGRDVVIKCRPLSSFSRRLKSILGAGHAHRHWDGARLLQRGGIQTGRPLAAARANVENHRCELLIVEFVPGRTLLDVLASVAGGHGPSVREQHAIARSLGSQIARLGQTLHNRDHKPSNLIVVENPSGQPEIAVIDCVGVSRPFVWRSAPSILKTAAVEPIGCGVFPRRALLARVVSSHASVWMQGAPTKAALRAFRRYLWHATARRVARHGDPRPTHNPLAATIPSPSDPPHPR